MKLEHKPRTKLDSADEAMTCQRHVPPVGDQYWDTRRPLAEIDFSTVVDVLADGSTVVRVLDDSSDV